MDKLPVEILSMLFERLDINSLLRCRKVCRKFYKIIQGIRITSLAISDQFSNCGRYFYTNHQIKESNLLTISKIQFNKSKFMKAALSRLKQLYVKNATTFRCARYTRSNIDIFNEFNSLEELQIDFIKTRRGDDLNLSKLKILTILKGSNVLIRLRTPNLTKFRTEISIDHFRFDYAEKLTHLCIFNYENNINKFKNLVYLNCKKAFLLPANDLLNNFLSLKELHCKETSRTIAIDLLKQIKVTRRLNFVFYFDGVSIEQFDDVSTYINSDGSLAVNLIKSFNDVFLNNKLSNVLQWPEEVNYCELLNLFPNQLTNQFLNDFFEKFINLRTVRMNFKLNEQIDLKLLTKFVEKCTYIDELSLINVSLPQTFFDTLHVLCPYLTDLRVVETGRNINNVNFMFNHQLLINFRINQQISYENIMRAFNLLSFASIGFTIQNKKIEVESLKNQKSFIVVDNNLAHFNHKQKMFNFLKDMFFNNLNYVEVEEENELN